MLSSYHIYHYNYFILKCVFTSIKAFIGTYVIPCLHGRQALTEFLTWGFTTVLVENITERDQFYLHTHTVVQFGAIKLIGKEIQYYRTC